MPIYKTGKLIDGKVQYRVFVNTTDENGKKKRLTRCAVGLTEAKDIEDELKLEAEETGSAGTMTLQELYEEYIAVKKHEVRTSTLIKCKSVLNNHVLNTELKDKRIDKLSKRVLQTWRNGLAKKDISISMKNNVIRDFNTLLNYAVKMDYLKKNQLAELGKFKDAYFTTAQDRMQYYTPEQFKRYIQVAIDTRNNLTDYGCYIFFILAYYTGMRKGEINALKWSDLDGNTLHVRRSIYQKANGYEETPPKNKSSYRSLQIPQKVLNLLNEYRDVLMKNVDYSLSLRICGIYKPIPDTVIENHNKQYAEAAGLPHIRIHDFRHPYVKLKTKKFRDFWSKKPTFRITLSSAFVFAPSETNRARENLLLHSLFQFDCP